jgi:hypothetical protein
MSENTMPRPIDAPLLWDGTEPGEEAERDERFPGVILLSVDDDGEAKRTAERNGDNWLICEWALTDDMAPPLNGRMWYVDSACSIPVSVCERLADISRGAA